MQYCLSPVSCKGRDCKRNTVLVPSLAKGRDRFRAPTLGGWGKYLKYQRNRMQIANYPIQKVLDECIKLSRLAGEAIMQIYNSDDFSKLSDVQIKSDNSPLTKADLAAHNIIVSRLEEKFPEIPCLSEESEDITFEQRKKWRQCFIIDPLDGTKEFIERNGEFTVNIALVVDGKPVLGVIYAPVLDVVYYGASGLGAFKQVSNEKPKPINIRSLQKINGKTHITLVSSRRHGLTEVQQICKNFESFDLTNSGSSLKMCLIAEGVADFYPRFGPTSEWDTAAAQAIVEQAGGQLVTVDFSVMSYNQKESLLNPFFLVLGDPNYDWKSRLVLPAV
jgi:3'(2'), 5'-bisphosphate nucleotidase